MNRIVICHECQAAALVFVAGECNFACSKLALNRVLLKAKDRACVDQRELLKLEREVLLSGLPNNDCCHRVYVDAGNCNHQEMLDQLSSEEKSLLRPVM